MNVFITFEVSDKQDMVRTEMINKGYYSNWFDSNVPQKRKYELPINCVWKPNVELAAGKTDIEQIIAQLNSQGHNIILKKLIVLSANPWLGLES
ncbi:MAG: hypothetical protein JST70_00745 [Bacteroidetes bacterium]|nr:hypothetical protein [Bacteroidota bacterium]